MIKLCFLLGGFQGNGGIGRVVSVLLNRFCTKNDVEIHVISYLEDQRPLLYELDGRIKRHVLYTAPVSMAKAMLTGHAVGRVRRLITEEKIDLLIACGALFYPLGILASGKTNAKCLCWEHTDPAASSDYRFQNAARRFAVKRGCRVVVLTKAAEQYYREKFPACADRLTQIPNPIADEAMRSPQYDGCSQKILSVGRLSYQKNFERLIRIASQLLPDYPEWSWDIFGEGEQRGELQALINDCGLEGRVTLRGQVNDLYDRYRDYAFLVMTSRYEGFPMSLIEGAANRLPLISFDIPTGPNEIITDGVNGFLIDAGDDDAMIEKIRCLIEDPARRAAMSDEAYALTDKFSINKVVDQWEELYVALARQEQNAAK